MFSIMINKPMDSENPFLTNAFKSVIEDHLHLYVKNLQPVPIDIARAHRYIGDFDGLLLSLGYQIKYHHILTRLNGFYCTTDYLKEIDYVLVPSKDNLDTLLNLHRSTLS